MADVTVDGTLMINGILWMVGGANTFIQGPLMQEWERNLMITGWGLSERGRQWFNSDTLQAEMWNGTEIVILG